VKKLKHYLPPHTSTSPSPNQPMLLIQGGWKYISQLQLLDLENVIVMFHRTSYVVTSDHHLPQRKCISCDQFCRRGWLCFILRDLFQLLIVSRYKRMRIRSNQVTMLKTLIAEFSNQNSCFQRVGKYEIWILDNFRFIPLPPIPPIITTETFLCRKKTS